MINSRDDAMHLLRVVTILSCFIFWSCQQEGSPKSSTVNLKPGDDIRAAARAHAEGTVFLLEPGVYRQQMIAPKDFQQFIATGDVILNGAMILNDWRREMGYWVTGNLPNPRRTHGTCVSDDVLCQFSEDLFVDNKLYRRVGHRKDVVPRTFFVEANKIYITDDPRGKVTEWGTSGYAFKSKAQGVILKNLIVEKYIV